MNMFEKSYDKKKWIIYGSIALVVVIGILISIFWGDKLGKDKENETDPNKDSENIVWSENGSYRFEETVETPSQDSEEVQIVVPSTLYGGSVASYSDLSTSAELKIHIGGNTDRSKTFKLVPTGIVFDAKNHTVVKPSELTEGKKVRVLALGDLKTGQETVEVVILNDDPNILYSPVVGVEKGDKGVQIVNKQTATKYAIADKVKVTNALSGQEYEKEKIKPGDRVFFYESEEKVTVKESEKSTSKDGVAPDKDKEIEYKTIIVSKAYIYPSAGK